MNTPPIDVKLIFEKALELSEPSARTAYLDAACSGNVALRAQIEGLLIALERAGSFLNRGPTPVPEHSATGTFDSAHASPPETGSYVAEKISLGAVIAGKYKLIEEIGEGGMGNVFLAQQTEPVKRLVAVKVIKPGMDSKAVLTRFEAERQALAMMDHPNIARVLDAGATDDGRPFFVMELVKGVPITKFCDDRKLTPQQRLELFVPVCQAIQHAHQKGVIHRDIKPNNVLVAMYDDRPVPKVIDFGVAKATGLQLTDHTLVTGFGSIVGTPEYMSPEQASFNQMDVDTRSDVYALGVLLYELLTGSPPFSRKELDKVGLLEIFRVIREQEPSRPSNRLSTASGLPSLAANRSTEPRRLTSILRGEVDWIVMKALEKDRGRRYETANGLAADVNRYLAGEAVRAVPPSVGYRLRKVWRKNRLVLTTVSAFVALLIVGVGVSSWLAVKASWAESFADVKREKAEKAEREAKDSDERARGAANDAARNARETRQSLDRLSVEQGLRLAENNDLFTALLWFAKPLERGGLSSEEERIHRMRYACYLRHTQGRPVLQQMFFLEEMPTQIIFSPDAKELVTVVKNGAQIWNLDTGQKVATLEQSQNVGQLRFLSACLAGQSP